MSKVVLFGTGRGADVAYRFLTRDSDHEVCGFATEARSSGSARLPRSSRGGVRGRGAAVPAGPIPDAHPARLSADERAYAQRNISPPRQKGYGFISYVNSHFYRAEDLQVGENCFILDNQSISLDVTDRQQRRDVVDQPYRRPEHRSSDHAWLASHVTVAANVMVRPIAFSASVRRSATADARADDTFVGANALVASNTAENSVHLAASASQSISIARAFMRVMMAKGKL